MTLPLHFLHIGKTGGTAVKEALRDHTCAGEFDITLHTHKTTLMDVPLGEKVFFFLRDPLSRFVSGFYSRQRQGRPRYDSRWRAGEHRAFLRFGTPNELAEALSATELELREAAVGAMRSIQHVRSGYRCWLGSPEYIRSRFPDFWYVGRQETLSRDFDAIRVALGLPETVTLPRDDMRAHRNPADTARHLSAEAQRSLREWYADDYVVLNICAEHQPAWTCLRAR